MTKFVVDNGKNLIQAYDAAETDALLNNKANSADVYSKTAADAKFYDKDAVDAIAGALNLVIGTKANANSVYTKSETLSLLSDKADKNGTYEELTAGHAGNLTSKVGEIDKTPYNFRTSGGSLDIGDLETDKIIGGSIAWNQLINPRTTPTTSYQVTFTFTSDGKCTLSGTATGGTAIATVFNDFAAIQGHKYLILGGLSNDIYLVITNVGVWGSSNRFDKGNGAIVGASASGNVALNLQVEEDTDATGKVLRPQFFDLTQMFGATIADYIYSLETATAGAGVAWFKKLFPKSYYAYNAGEIMSVMTSAHKMVGFNALDISDDYGQSDFDLTDAELTNTQTDTRDVFGMYICLNKNNVFTRLLKQEIIDSNGRKTFTFTIPENVDFDTLCLKHNGSVRDLVVFNKPNAELIKGVSYCLSFTIKGSNPSTVGGLVIEEINLNLAWDGERNGEYEPYVVHNYPLQVNLELRGIPKLDASNNLYYDGDEYESSGKVTRKYAAGVLDGTQNVISQYMNAAQTALIVRFSASGIKASESGAVLPNIINNKGVDVLSANSQYTTDKTSISVSYGDYAGVLVLVNGETTVDGVKQYLSSNPINIIYEKAETAEESASSYDNPQIVNDFGTEQYVDGREVEISVGHDTFYQANLKAKLEMSPDSPANDGSYLMQHYNGENSYIPYISPIPTPPTTDGTYILKAVVSSGVATLQWIEETT